MSNAVDSPNRTKGYRWWHFLLLGGCAIAAVIWLIWLIRLAIIYWTVMQLTGHWSALYDDTFTKWRVAAAGRVVIRRHAHFVKKSLGLSEEELVGRGEIDLCNQRLRAWNGLVLSVEVTGDDEIQKYIRLHLHSPNVSTAERWNAESVLIPINKDDTARP